MTTAPAPNAVFVFGSQNPVDLLSNAASVTRFLAEVAPFVIESPQSGVYMSEAGINGLVLILLAVENTINEAANRL